MWLMMLACVNQKLPPPPSAADTSASTATELTDTEATDTEATDTEATDTEPTADDTAPTDTAPVVLSCPAEMSAVTDGDEVLYCIDTWEVWVDDPTLMGSADQYSGEVEAPTTAASSLEGVVPSVGMSFGQAQAICGNTPMLNTAGEVVGYKHLVTLSEWQDAGDGVVGEGGSVYPYGDDYDEDACVCASEDDEILYAEIQPTGSFPGCVSDFGVYDQAGNVWEWADPEQVFDVDAWWSSAESFGLHERDGYLATSLDLSQVDVEMLVAGVDGDWEIGEGGRLEVSLTIAAWDYRQSYPIGQIRLRGQERYSLLPVEVIPLDPTTDETTGVIRAMTERDGHPIVEKVGGAHYVSHDSCAIHESSSDIVHHHSFDGSIGFRCAAPPITLE